jgi:small subunit ribosomal protein S6
MRRYETISIIRPNATEDEIAAICDRSAEIITAENGEIIRVDHWGLKKLAYLIKKEQQGYYVYCEFAGTPAAVAEMERIFKIDDRVLKYMTVKLQNVYVPDEPAEEGEEAVEPDSEEISNPDNSEDKAE